MPLVDARCPNCGGGLIVDSDKKAAVCPYCDEAYIVQDAISNYTNNYNIQNTVNIGELHAGSVQLHDDHSAQARLQAADTFLKLRQYDKAAEAYQDVCDLAPKDYRGWWGKLNVLSREFSFFCSPKTLNEFRGLADKAILMAPAQKKASLQKMFNDYCVEVSNALPRKENDTLYIPKNTKWEDLFEYRDSPIRQVYIEDGVQMIGERSFENFQMESVFIPDSVKEIGVNAFSNCNNLQSVSLPDSNVFVAHGAFQGCKNLKNLRVSKDAVLAITLGDEDYAVDSDEPKAAFYFCPIEKIEFGEGREEIDTAAFFWPLYP